MMPWKSFRTYIRFTLLLSTLTNLKSTWFFSKRIIHICRNHFS
uniref:Uncharacterized protein n=1 Tax=Arundo donax TaxID=35708 RepID=A0A0A9BZ39_ARUDO